MSINRTVRYAAKEAAKLMYMRGIYECTIAGCRCQCFPSDGVVYVVQEDKGQFVPIAKSWINL